MSDRMSTWGIVPMILLLGRNSTNFYKGQTTWLVISFLFLSVMYLSQMPWINRKKDFQCHGNISDACLAECYNKHFPVSVVGVWNTFGLTVYSVFFMMEFSVSQNLNVSLPHPQQSLEEESSSGMLCREKDTEREEMISTLSKEKLLLSVFLFYYLVQMAIQGIFLIFLWNYQRSLIKEDIWCHTTVCPGPFLCVFLGTREKLMSMALMTMLSVVIIIFCFIFFLYTISLYALTSVILRDTEAKSQQLSG
ncbi:gap junction beta-2 protein-like [Arvicola amphibius]|uniref:gap junction beta-2 protein-like n=1 Tax=Arvicola amphibius TaxID=1047088 RepID=UPI001C096556|nr:gap junction beta-2 protein-like [Arvicola amphibius]